MHLARTQRRGVVIVFFAVTAAVLLMFAALAIDLGYLRGNAAEMQNAVDSAALAGASALHSGEAAAIALAQVYAGKNRVAAPSSSTAMIPVTSRSRKSRS